LPRVPAALALAATLALLACAAPVRAQSPTDRTVSFGIGGGISMPAGSTRDVYEDGFDGQVYVRLDLGTMPLAFRGDFTFQSYDLHPSQFAGKPGVTGGTGTLVGALASTQVYLSRGAVRPYVVAGLGGYTVRTEFDGGALPSATDRHFGVNGGAGVLATMGVVVLYAEGRLDNIYTGRAFDQGDVLQLVPLTLGIVF